MVKLFLLALSVSAATLAGSYAQRQFRPAPHGSVVVDVHGKDGKAAALTETELLAFPVISNGEIEGFFFLRLAFAFDAAANRSHVPADVILSDGFNSFAASHSADDRQLDVDAVAEGVKAAVNKLAGAPLISEIYLTQIDYFAGADVRKKSIERRLALKEPEKKQAPADGGHGAPAH